MTAIAPLPDSPTLDSGPGALVLGRQPGHALPGPCYTSPEVFELDVAAVWARSWLLVATEAARP